MIEVAGDLHLSAQGHVHDQRRDRYLCEKGYCTMRIAGYSLITDPAGVMRRIEKAIDACAAQSRPLTPGPSPPNKFGRRGEPDRVAVMVDDVIFEMEG